MEQISIEKRAAANICLCGCALAQHRLTPSNKLECKNIKKCKCANYGHRRESEYAATGIF